MKFLFDMLFYFFARESVDFELIAVAVWRIVVTIVVAGLVITRCIGVSL